MKAALDIPNRDARRLWLAANGLSGAPAGPVDVPGMIAALGLLQLDTIRNVTRAHNHILWSRNHRYREGMLWPHLASRALFEHFTHDASLLPVSLLPLWQVQFRRLGARAARGAWYQSGLTRAEIEAIRGVNVDSMVHTLLQRRLIKISGRKDVPGQPFMYRVTKQFLNHFGLRDLGELPKIDEISQALAEAEGEEDDEESASIPVSPEEAEAEIAKGAETEEETED
ncbi:MAG: SMC-Scp complex subunit ScpB [Candidatus Omnitrophica bacterium]|nr:SMC-Scp complex subunit ScpB [Candidatus Omnitrophota bacterium]